MKLWTPETSALFSKEVRQLSRSRSAIATTVLLPTLLTMSIVGTAFSPTRSLNGSSFNGVPASLLRGFDDPSFLLTHLLIPLMTMVLALLVPSLLALTAITQEREKRSLDLLIALPVRLSDIVTAKLTAITGASAIVIVPFTALYIGIALYRGASPLFGAELVVESFCGTAAAVASAMLTGAFAKDYRTAQQINGASIAPIVLVTMALLFLVPGDAKPLAVAGAMVLFAAGSAAFMLRFLSFERYLT